MKFLHSSGALLFPLALMLAACSDSEPTEPGLDPSVPEAQERPADVARRDLAAALFAEDEYAACSETLAPLLSVESPTVWDLVAGGVAAQNELDPERARELFERALDLDPDSAAAHFNLAGLDVLDGELEAAQLHYEAALAASPDDVPTELALANVLYDLDLVDEADAHYARLQEVGLDFSGSWYVSILYRRGQLKYGEGLEDEGDALSRESDQLRARGITAPTNKDILRGNFGRVLPPAPLARERLAASDPGSFAPAAPLGFDPAHRLRGLIPAGIKEYWKRGKAPDESGTIGAPDWIGWAEDGIWSLSGGKQQRIAEAGAERLLGLDIEDDGDLDLLALRGSSVDLILRQPGEWQAKTVAELPSVPADALLVDYDHDGDLDLLAVGSFGAALLRNDGAELDEGGFTDATAEARLEFDGPLSWCRAEDFDTDQDVDLMVGSQTATHLADNLRGGHFAWTDERLAGLPTGSAPVVVDVDADGRPDLIFDGAGRYIVRADGSYKRSGTDSLAGLRGLLGDLDGNGDADGYGLDAAGQLSWMPGFGPAQALDVAPFDELVALIPTREGGSNDLVVLREGAAFVHAGTPAAGRSDLRLCLRGIKDNRRAVGAVVELRAGELYRRIYWTHEDQLLGLGGASSADVLRITWPNGVVQNLVGHPSGDDLVVVQKEGLVGSCPFLYAWDGEHYTFISDVLGITPLGLPMGPGMLVPPDHDEFVLVTGEQLRPHEVDGGSYYDLQFTEELREVTYLDKARLVVVDHPVGTEIFPDERFCFPPFPGGHTHITEAPAAPLWAREVDLTTGLASGRDWAPEVAAIDGLFAAPFEHYHGRFQGLARPHMVEYRFDPASVAAAERLRLFMTGWFFWTNASVNMASARVPGIDFVPPIFSVPDGQGGWRELGPPFGFPAGKTKTMVVDLTGQLDPADPRLRVFSTLRLYWDAVRLGTDGDDAPMRTHELAPVSAKLWQRGFSRPFRLMGGHELEWFDWDELEGTPRWNQHPGRYTKLGEVLPLLDEAEDQFVILGSGDALRLRFDASQAPPLEDGWRRDFLLYLDGWAKDRDPNSIAVEYVEPMPFHAMSGFPYGADEHFPDGPAHRAWRAEWNTREARSWIEPLATKR